MSLLAMCQPNILYGGPAGNCPRVLNPFLSASYSNNLHYTTSRPLRQPRDRRLPPCPSHSDGPYTRPNHYVILQSATQLFILEESELWEL
jgi:hypothetical protein